MWTNPIYLREYSKRILKGALYNDSSSPSLLFHRFSGADSAPVMLTAKFLADMQIMDYSLVVGIDLVRAELVGQFSRPLLFGPLLLCLSPLTFLVHLSQSASSITSAPSLGTRRSSSSSRRARSSRVEGRRVRVSPISYPPLFNPSLQPQTLVDSLAIPPASHRHPQTVQKPVPSGNEPVLHARAFASPFPPSFSFLSRPPCLFPS